MDTQFETYDSRIVSKDEYVFWNQALNRQTDVAHYNWSRVPPEAKQLADNMGSSYDGLWVESHWKTGNDPALFGKKNDQIYLLARWGTDEAPLRTEEQFVLSYQRRVERAADHENHTFQCLFFFFEAVLAIGGVAGLTKNGLEYGGTAFLVAALLLEMGRRRHKNRGMTNPLNVWEQQALAFIEGRQAASG